MTFIEGVAVNDAVRLHYLDAHADGGHELPIVIVPGLSESAEEYTGLMDRLSPRRCVAISLRGRGQSDTPASGYTLDDHASDVLAVVRHVSLPRYALVAFSRGVPYAIRCAGTDPERVAGLVLGDYAAVHGRLPEEWTPGSWLVAGAARRSSSASLLRSCRRYSGSQRTWHCGMSCLRSAVRRSRSAAAEMDC